MQISNDKGDSFHRTVISTLKTQYQSFALGVRVFSPTTSFQGMVSGHTGDECARLIFFVLQADHAPKICLSALQLHSLRFSFLPHIELVLTVFSFLIINS